MTDYKIIKATNHADLEKQVRANMQNGWETIGGVNVSLAPDIVATIGQLFPTNGDESNAHVVFWQAMGM